MSKHRRELYPVRIMPDLTIHQTKPLYLFAAFGTGCFASLLVFFNGELARHSNVLYSTWAAHAVGSVAAVAMLVLSIRSRKPNDSQGLRAPIWAYSGGLFGAAIAMLTTFTVNSPLKLSGTLALVLAGQTVFSLAADRWGLFGLVRRSAQFREMAALGLIAMGSLFVILAGAI